MAELLAGGISAAIALLISSNVKKHLLEKYNIKTTPLYEFIGVIIGIIIILLFYYLFLKKWFYSDIL